MGLFEKKYCDICGEKIKFLGNKKLSDGNMCKDCTEKLSPFFTGRKQCTVDQIKEQLDYREKNKQKVADFTASKSWGRNSFLFVDESKGNFIVTGHNDFKNYNPDVVPLSAVTGTSTHVSKFSDEIKTKDQDGKSVSYNPPRYSNRCKLYFVINVDHPYFDEMSFALSEEFVVYSTGSEMVRPEHNPYYVDMMRLADEIKAYLLNPSAQMQQKKAVRCAACGAVVVPNEKGCCEYCGSALE